MNRFNHKAFTLIEMLVVVIILGVVLAIAIPAVSNIMSSNRSRMYQTYMKIVEEKTKLFIDQHKGELKSKNATCFQVNYQTLLENDFLVETDVHCNGSIIITKAGNNSSFSSEYYLTCVDKNNDVLNESDSVPTGCTSYQFCAPGDTTCESESEAPSMLKVELIATNTPTLAVNGYLQKQVWSLTTTGTPTYYYIKTTRAATVTTVSGGTMINCGSATTPTNCGTSGPGYGAGTSLSISADTWYQFTSKPTITYNTIATSPATLYAAISDGTNLSETTSETVSMIDNASPNLTVGTINSSTTSITINYTMIDSLSEIGSYTCSIANAIVVEQYISSVSTIPGTYKQVGAATSTSCTATGLTKDTTYYYKICATDNVGNASTCKTGSTKTAAGN